MSWGELQLEVATWTLHNFGQQGAHQPMLGVMEEVGEFLSARQVDWLHHPASRGEAIDALGDQMVYALNLCEKGGLSFELDIAATNYPESLSDAELMGALALASRAVLKFEQGIRGYDFAKMSSELKVAISMWYRWASYQPVEYNLPPLLAITREVWASVRQRDWKARPTNAHQPV